MGLDKVFHMGVDMCGKRFYVFVCQVVLYVMLLVYNSKNIISAMLDFIPYPRLSTALFLTKEVFSFPFSLVLSK